MTRVVPNIELGKISITKGAADLLYNNDLSAADYIGKHKMGNWGDLDEEDKRINNEGLENEGQLLSSYSIDISGQSNTLWIITEGDRSATTILLPDER